MKNQQSIWSAVLSSVMIGVFMLISLAGIQQVGSAAAIKRPASSMQSATRLTPISQASATQSSHAPAPVAADGGRPATVVAGNSARVALPAAKPLPSSRVGHLTPTGVSGGAGGVAAASMPQTASSPSTTSATGPVPQTQPSSSFVPTYTYTSSNWSGYIAMGSGFNGVSGSWIVPHPTGSGRTLSADAAWVGVGGVTTSDLIQAGTDDSVTPSGQILISAFYEMLPDPAVAVPGMTVSPGDSMSVALHEVRQGEWEIDVNDVTEAESFTATMAYASAGTSAEWIEEDPSFASGGQVPFDRFGAVEFSGATATAGGAQLNMSQVNAQGVAMVAYPGKIVASPSAIGADGRSFTVVSDP